MTFFAICNSKWIHIFNPKTLVFYSLRMRQKMRSGSFSLDEGRAISKLDHIVGQLTVWPTAREIGAFAGEQIAPDPFTTANRSRAHCWGRSHLFCGRFDALSNRDGSINLHPSISLSCGGCERGLEHVLEAGGDGMESRETRQRGR